MTVIDRLDRIINTAPLRQNRAFRLFWMGTTAQSFARQVSVVAVMLQIWEITQDALWLGVAGLASAIPMVVFGMIGGWLADHFDRRAVTMWTTIGALACSALLVLQAWLSVNSVLVLLLIIVAQLSFTSAGAPARRSILPRVLTDQQLGSGIALTHVSFQAAMLAGPALGGILVLWSGFTGAYIVEAVGFAAALLGIAALPQIPADKTGRRMTVASVFAGVETIAKRPVLRGSFLIDIFATVLVMPLALLPVLNAERFGDNPVKMGLLISAMAAGGLLAGVLSGPLVRASRSGVVQILAAASWTMALGGLAFTYDYVLAIVLLTVAGAADTIAVITRGTVVQLDTPDDLRGRVSAVEQVVGVAGPELGNFRAGTMASGFGTTLSMAIGAGLALVAIGTVATLNSGLRNYRLPAEDTKAETV